MRDLTETQQFGERSTRVATDRHDQLCRHKVVAIVKTFSSDRVIISFHYLTLFHSLADSDTIISENNF